MSHSTLTILMAQLNPTVGAIEQNTQQVLQVIREHQHTHQIILFPELMLTGYPPEDLLLHDTLYERMTVALNDIQAITENCHVIIGHPHKEQGHCYNSATILHQRRVIKRYHKQHLPNYGVFDEQRYFTAGPAEPCIFSIKEHRFGLCICEDIWQTGPVDDLIHHNIDTLLVINASPFEDTKFEQRMALLKTYTQKHISIVYVNLVGGQDELVFDGRSIVLNAQGHVCALANAFEAESLSVTLEKQPLPGYIAPTPKPIALIYQALCCGLRDYLNKNKFKQVMIGLSGGIDSALTLAIAVDALGSEQVHAVLMPSRYTHNMSIEDAIQQAVAMNVSYSKLSIEPAFTALLETLESSFQPYSQDITEENMQARIRGVLLMALSNKTGSLVLTTSNKSETAVGYATLYGDMCGGFSVLKDVLKTQVYQLAHYRNTQNQVIPSRVLERPPTAELAFNQKDEDSLPPYPVLDKIITQFMEHRGSIDELIAAGYPKDIVIRVIQLIKRNEYKRRQSAPGTKISACAFGRDWRYPISSALE